MPDATVQTATPINLPLPPLAPGDPAPSFRQRSGANPNFSFDTAAGRFLLLAFVGSANDPHSAAAIAAMRTLHDVFDDRRAAFFTVTNDPADEGRIAEVIPGHRIFWDFDRSVTRLYGMERQAGGIARSWVLIDPTMRVRCVVPFRPDGSDLSEIIAILRALPDPAMFAGFPLQAPVIVLPQVFEPALCDHLIALYDAHGGIESGFMREVDGKTVGIHDPSHKRRRDHTITDKDLLSAIQARFTRRIVPEIRKIHQFEVTRMERYIIGCYTSEDGGHFRAHRDNTTKGTAHRRFAVSVNLNTEFDGGEVSFPEYGPRSFKAPKGGAVVFSCSLLHAVSKVTAGRRYAFLPFLYDDAAARIREENNRYLDQGVKTYSP
jgi:predicted 2-oxoglutarate/Fe(II)-dependent dioxygenase YbiX/alkyl hydroperoxide reductase subunit AhpC